MKHLSAVSALIIASDNAVISTQARVERMLKAATDIIESYDIPTTGKTLRLRDALARAADALSTLPDDVNTSHQYAVVLAHDLFNEASEDYR